MYHGEKPRGGEQNLNSLEAIREMTHLHIVGVERSKRAGPGPSQSARKQSTSETTGPAPGGQHAVNIFGKSELDIQTYYLDPKESKRHGHRNTQLCQQKLEQRD